MNKLFACILALFVLLCGCGDDTDILSTQKNRIVSYLTSTHSPRLVAEEDREEGSSAEYYVETGNSVFRYIEGIDNPERERRPQVTRTSLVTVTFRMYVFNYANISTSGTNLTMPFFSNDPLLEGAYA